MENLLQGIYDLHVHTSPDVAPRKCGDPELAERFSAAKMRGFAIKCHFADTSARAVLLQERFPQLRIVGGITLNRAAGGLNPYAVERSAQIGGKMVWFPTLESRAYQAYQHRNDPAADLEGYLSVCNANGELLPDALRVLDVAAKYNMVVGTGHISADEGMALVKAAAERNCRIVLTHADNPADLYTIEQQKKAVDLGAYVEHSYFTVCHNRTSIEEVAAQIRAVGCDHVILTSDLGQLNSPYPEEGLAQYLSLLHENGFTHDELRQMTVRVPEALLL